MKNTEKVTIAPARQDVCDAAKAIAGVFNAALGADYFPLQIANAVRCISGASATRVMRITTGSNGLRREKEYAAYVLNGTGEVAPLTKSGREKPSPKAKGNTTAQNRERARAIAKVLGTQPMTVQEINAALGTDYAPLQVSNAVSSIPNAASCKVTRTVLNRRGEQVEKTYAAYFIMEAGV